MKYIIWTMKIIRDALAYNEHKTLNGDALDRIEEELNVLEEIEETEYTKEQFVKFHADLLELDTENLIIEKDQQLRELQSKNKQLEEQRKLYAKFVHNLKMECHFCEYNEDGPCHDDCHSYLARQLETKIKNIVRKNK